MTLWDEYDFIVSEIAVTGYTERGENIGGWLAERRRAADALRDRIQVGSGTLSAGEASPVTAQEKSSDVE